MHKPGYLRAMFEELVERGETGEEFFDPAKQARFELMSTEEQLRLLAGQLWHCTDCMPGHVCEDLDMPTGSSFARAARVIRQR
jgi:hypothetical protein